MVDFYEIDFMKGVVILVKVDEMWNILKSVSHCLLVERWQRMYAEAYLELEQLFSRTTMVELLCENHTQKNYCRCSAGF